MSSGLNKVQLIGRIGKDPQIRQVNNNVLVARFSLVTSEYFLDKAGQRQERAEWHNVVMWRKLAERAEKVLFKGRTIYIEGKLSTRSWTDTAGTNRYITEIIAENFLLLDRKDRPTENGFANAETTNSDDNTNFADEDKLDEPIFDDNEEVLPF